MSDIDKKILEAEALEKRSKREEPKRRWLKTKCKFCSNKIEYSPTDKFEGRIKCPHCGEVFTIDRLDDFVE